MSKKTQKIFLVEDDPNFGSVMRSYLQMNGYAVNWIDDGRYAMKEFTYSPHDICILDVMLPHVDGFTLAREIRKIDKKVPIVFLTAKTLKADIMEGFKIGADDYITKPFDSEVLLMKIKAILKRQQTKINDLPEETYYNIGKYHYDCKTRVLCIGTIKKNLSPKEGELLKLLCQHKNTILDHTQALLKIWREETYFTKRSMDVYITKLRKYLANDKSVEISNVHGSGYILKA